MSINSTFRLICSPAGSMRNRFFGIVGLEPLPKQCALPAAAIVGTFLDIDARRYGAGLLAYSTTILGFRYSVQRPPRAEAGTRTSSEKKAASPGQRTCGSKAKGRLGGVASGE